MPAWGATHGDDSIWPVVAFMIRLPDLDAAAYQQMLADAAGYGHHAEDAASEEHGHGETEESADSEIHVHADGTEHIHEEAAVPKEPLEHDHN